MVVINWFRVFFFDVLGGQFLISFDFLLGYTWYQTRFNQLMKFKILVFIYTIVYIIELIY